MRIFQGYNVNQTYPNAMAQINLYGVKSESRAGDVIAFPYPVMTVTENPTCRVLFDPVRDANPFFHLMESLWMINGRSDADFLNLFVKDFGERFAESNGHIWGAYGHRWRREFGFDQLEETIKRLKQDPNDRRVVISMWDPEDDFTVSKKDHPCNTHMYPRIVNGVLDLTICVRSNDVIWGCYGANAVHLSMVQEYLAGRIGVPVGKMYQMSNNLHVYTEVYDKVWPGQKRDLYLTGEAIPDPIMEYPDHWDRDLENFFIGEDTEYVNSWFTMTAAPMARVHDMWKSGDKTGALELTNTIRARDWRIACYQWMSRRMG